MVRLNDGRLERQDIYQRTLNDDVTALTESGTLHWVGCGGTSISLDIGCG